MQIYSFSYGGLAQLARAPALQAGGQRFESVILHKRDAFWFSDDIKQEKERFTEDLWHIDTSKTVK